MAENVMVCHRDCSVPTVVHYSIYIDNWGVNVAGMISALVGKIKIGGIMDSEKGYL